MNEKKNISSKKSRDWNKFHSAVNNFINQRNINARIHEIYRQGIQVFSTVPDSQSASLFLLNKTTFEFDYKMSVPDNIEKSISETYSILVDYGVIGKILQSTSIMLFPDEEIPDFPYYCLIVPLIAPNGVIGISLILLNHYPGKITEHNKKTMILFGGIYGSTIENATLLTRLKNTTEELEQRVAAKTMNLAQSKRELNAILDAVHTGILVISTSKNEIIKANPIAVELIGDKETKIVGSRYFNYLDYTKGELDYTIDNLKTYKNFESTLRKANGEILPILRTISTINLGNQELRIESFLDISDRKKAEIALKESNELLELKVEERTEDLQLLVHKLKEEIQEREKAQKEMSRMLEKEKELNDLKNRFVTLVSHEFRTPLTIIRSSAQLVEKFGTKLSLLEKSEYLHRIMKTVDYMKDLLENVIFIGKSDAEKVQVNSTKFDIEAFSTSLINDLQFSLEKKREIILATNCNKNICVTDEKVLRQILINILTNAIKYSPDNTPVEFHIECYENGIEFTIKDYGCGIPEDEQDKIFDLFYRANNVTSVSGTGLGMSVVLRSVKMLNGKIELTSKENAGTTVVVYIPYMNI